MKSRETETPRGRPIDLDKHEAARAERLAFAGYLRRLKNDGDISRKQVAEWFGVPQPIISRWSADEVKDRPTIMPDEGWRRTLALNLRRIVPLLTKIADDLTTE